VTEWRDDGEAERRRKLELTGVVVWRRGEARRGQRGPGSGGQGVGAARGTKEGGTGAAGARETVGEGGGITSAGRAGERTGGRRRGT
jgi:hypothetical protein